MYDKTIAKQLLQSCRFVYSFDDDLVPPGDPIRLKFEGTVSEGTRLGAFAKGVFRSTHLPQIAKKLGLGSKEQTVTTSTAGQIDFADKRVVAFSGTFTEFTSRDIDKILRSVIDWSQNFTALPRTAANFGDTLPAGMAGKVHDGFAKELVRIWSKVLSGVQDNPKGLPVYVTGHSQGGAIAAIATAALEAAGVKVEAAYTFAAPRPGDTALADSVEAPVYRFEFGDDIVPHVPISIDLAKLLRNGHPLLGPVLAAVDEFKGGSHAINYVGMGHLTYRRPGGAIQAELSREQEATLLVQRKAGLRDADDFTNLIKHHTLGDGAPGYHDMLDD